MNWARRQDCKEDSAEEGMSGWHGLKDGGFGGLPLASSFRLPSSARKGTELGSVRQVVLITGSAKVRGLNEHAGPEPKQSDNEDDWL